MAPSLYEQLIDAANMLFGHHPRTRALHAKGVWCEGTFTASAEAARLSRAAVFSGAAVPALVRFSNGGGDPEGHDGAREARGMAVKLRPAEGEEVDILATNNPAFVTRTPEDFLELLRLRAPDPRTGEVDMEALGAFLAAHPESQPVIQHGLTADPPASYATQAYRSPHAFQLVNEAGEGTWVRYRWLPEAGVHEIPYEEAQKLDRDYLRAELAERLARGPVRFELALQVAGPGDPLDDPTAIWPEERELVSAGTLAVTALVDDPERGGHIEVFDPTRVADGIELSDDPVLRARPHAYSVSAHRRLGTADPA